MTALGHIADVRMGVTLRGRDATRPDSKGSCRMIRISDITNDGHLTNPDLAQFEPGEPIKRDLFLRPGDILFPNRGIRTTAHVFRQQDANVIVGAQFFIIRVDHSVADPQYVAWYLRTEVASQHFQLRRKGTLVQTVQRKDIEELQLPLPSLALQHKVVELDDLAIYERQLSLSLAERQFHYLQRRLLNSVAKF